MEFELKNPPGADGEELFFAYARIVDQNGTIVPTADLTVQFNVQGPVKLLSPEKIKTEAGIAAALLQVETKAGEITLQASSEGLPVAVLKAITTTVK